MLARATAVSEEAETCDCVATKSGGASGGVTLGRTMATEQRD